MSVKLSQLKIKTKEFEDGIFFQRILHYKYLLFYVTFCIKKKKNWRQYEDVRFNLKWKRYVGLRHISKYFYETNHLFIFRFKCMYQLANLETNVMTVQVVGYDIFRFIKFLFENKQLFTYGETEKACKVRNPWLLVFSL